MKLTDIIVKQAIITELPGTDRDAAVTAMLDALVTAGAAPLEIRAELLSRIRAREEKQSTGFGLGVAVPHVKHPRMDRVAAAIGLSQAGLDFKARDEKPVHSVFLLLSPEDRPEDHLQAMEVIFKNLSKDAFRRFLRQAGSREDVISLLEEADSRQFAG